MKEKFIISIISTVSNYLISLIAFYFLFLNLNVELMGIFIFLNSIINLGFIFFDLGFKTIYYRYSIKKDYEQYFSSFFFIKIILIFINISLSLLLITIFQLWVRDYLIYLLLFLSSMVTLFLADILIINLRAIKKILLCEFIFSIYIIGKNSSIIFIALNISNISDPLLFLYFSNFIFDLLFIGFLIYFSKNELKKLNKPRKEIIFLYLKDSKFIIIRALLYIFVINIGNVILAYSFGHNALAYFSLVYQIILLFNIISQSLIPLYLRFYSEYFEENNISLIREITHQIEKYSSILFLSIIIIVFLNGKLIFSNFLSKYLTSIPLLYIMVFAPYFLGISRPYENQFIPGKKETIFAFSGIFMYLLQFILMILLIPKKILIFNMPGLGIIGYGLAYTIPIGIYAIICHYYSKKIFNIISQKNIFLHIIFALLAFLSAIVLKIYVLNLIIKNQFLLLISSTFILLVIFFGELILFKQLNKNDFIFFFELLQLKRYKETLKQELRR